MNETRRPALAQISANLQSELPPAPRHSSASLPELELGLFQDARGVFMDENGDNEDTQTSFPKSDDSNISNLSLIEQEEPSDDLERRMLDHARWSKRNALESDPVVLQPFGKAKGRQSLASRMGGFRSQDQAESQGKGTLEDSLPASSDWGKKGKRKNDFLRRLTGQEKSVAQQDVHDADKGTHDYQISSRSDDVPNQGKYEVVDADTPLPSIEEQLPSSERKSDDIDYRDTGTERRKARSGQGSTATSVFASKELHKDGPYVRNELHQVESRAVATNRLGQMRHGAEKKARTQAPAVLSGKRAEDVTGAYDRLENDHLESHAKPHQRQSSLHLLRQLARVSSSSPTPTQSRESRSVAETSEPALRRSRMSADSKSKIPLYEHSRRSTANTSRGLAPESFFPTPPYDDKSPQTQPTPAVTGAWVDTPDTTKHVSSSIQKNQRGEYQSESRSAFPESSFKGTTKIRPKPESALETILRSSDNEALQNPLRESTIASLKDLVEKDETGDLSTILELDEDTLNLVGNVNVPIQQGQELRAEEKEALRRMNEALKSARTGLRDASKGIKRVENHIEQAEKNQNHYRRGHVCEHCGCPGNITLSGLLYGAWVWYLSFYFSWPKNGRLRLTWLGLFALVLTSWMTTEFTLCEIYCQPIYAKSMVGFGVDMNAPRIPYVAYTILVERPFGWILRIP